MANVLQKLESFCCKWFHWYTTLILLFHVDIDECTQGLDNCSENAVCTNTVGSYTCTCSIGFVGDGTSCIGEIYTNIYNTCNIIYEHTI